MNKVKSSMNEGMNQSSLNRKQRVGAGIRILFVLNVVLAVSLTWGLLRGNRKESGLGGIGGANASAPNGDSATNNERQKTSIADQGVISQSSQPAATPFTAVYSADPKQFVANLRSIHCPEQTIRDIIKAEVHRRYKKQEEALKPTPADHVPFAWSANTTEPRLLERREEAATLSREEGSILRDTLACEETVTRPLYAMTSSDLRFEQQLAATPNLDSCSIRQVHDNYWNDVQVLLQRTKGFWLPADVAELQTLKERRRLALSGFLADQ